MYTPRHDRRLQLGPGHLAPASIVRVQLTSGFDSAGKASGVFVRWDKKTSALVATTVKVSVYRGSGTASGASGQTVLCTFMPDARRFEVVEGSALAVGVLDDALVYGGSATCSIWTGTPNAETDSGANETVYCFKLNAGESIAAGSKVDVGKTADGWQVLNVNCPA